MTHLEFLINRASEIVIEKGIDAMDAMKLAIEENNKLMYSLVDGSRLNERGTVAMNHLAEKTYNRLRK